MLPGGRRCSRKGSLFRYFTGSCGIVIGNEAKGPSPLLNHRAEAVVSIPLHHNVESLNAAVAAAVLLFEAAKQRQIKTQ